MVEESRAWILRWDEEQNRDYVCQPSLKQTEASHVPLHGNGAIQPTRFLISLEADIGTSWDDRIGWEKAVPVSSVALKFYHELTLFPFADEREAAEAGERQIAGPRMWE